MLFVSYKSLYSQLYKIFHLKFNTIILDTFSKKQKWKFILFITAIIIGIASMWYTNDLVTNLSREERKKAELWAEAMNKISTADLNQDVAFAAKILQDNETVPVIWADQYDSIKGYRNLDPVKSLNQSYIRKQLLEMKNNGMFIELAISDTENAYVYYKESILLSKLYYYPYIQLGVIFLFILVSYLVLSTSRKAEQNQVWVGLAKETAHQLGTPISSLVAWIELLKMKESDKILVTEVEKDVNRLETITERFSKIGSSPVLVKTNVIKVLNNSIIYLKSRTSHKVSYQLHFSENEEIIVPVNVSLFEWVIENLCKNAIDAMDGEGSIDVYVTDHIQVVYVDIMDSGKGIPKSKYKTIFQPGYTTKKRGWGLGLSLTKRIIEIYHSGKIFVKNSEISEGTTFRIALKK